MARAIANMLGLYSTYQRDVNLILGASQEYASRFPWIYMNALPIDLRFKYESEMRLSWESMPPQCPPLEVSWIKVYIYIWYIYIYSPLLNLNRFSLSLQEFLGEHFFGSLDRIPGQPSIMPLLLRPSTGRAWKPQACAPFLKKVFDIVLSIMPYSTGAIL